MGDVTENFSLEEFTCKCGCGWNPLNHEFVNKLQLVRDSMGIPLRVNSGCRCEDYNEEVGGVPHSSHVRGNAADIACWDSEMRLHLIVAALEHGFLRIGIAKTFLHLDLDPFLPAPRMWTY